MRLYAPTSYLEASDELKDVVCNGCGPKALACLVPSHLWGLNIEEP